MKRKQQKTPFLVTRRRPGLHNINLLGRFSPDDAEAGQAKTSRLPGRDEKTSRQMALMINYCAATICIIQLTERKPLSGYNEVNRVNWDRRRK